MAGEDRFGLGRRVTDLARLRTYVGRARRRAGSRVRGSSRVPGLLSIVVPVYNVEAYLDECLVSLRGQEYEKVEIVVVDDGSPDGSLAIARRHSLRDPRVRIVRRTNGGLSAARNTGVTAARGEFLAFVDSDDRVTPWGYQRSMEALASSGSDFAVFRYERINRALITPAARWIRTAHAQTRLGTTLADFPDILVNSMACSKVFRRDYWDRTGLSFVEGIIWEDQQVTAEAYARARGFDVLSDIGYSWRIRHDQSSISQAKKSVAVLRAQFKSANESIGVLRQYATHEIATERLLQLVRNDMPQFTSKIIDADDGFWELMREELPTLIDQMDRATYLKWVPAQQKVLNHLIMSGQRRQAEEFLRVGGLSAGNYPVGREDIGHIALLPWWQDPAVGVPDECFLLAESQTELRRSLRSVRRTSPSSVEIYGWAYIDNVDLSQTALTTRAWASSEGHEDVPLKVLASRDEGIDEYSASGFCDYRDTACTVTIEVDALAEGRWTVQVEVAVDGMVRSGSWANAWKGGTAILPCAVQAGHASAGLVTASERGPLTVDVFRSDPVVLGQRLETGILTLECAGEIPDRLSLHRRRLDGSVAGKVTSTPAADTWQVSFDVGSTEEPDGQQVPNARLWAVSAEYGNSERPVRYGPRVKAQDDVAARLYRAGVRRDGHFEVRVFHEAAWMTAVQIGTDRVDVRLMGVRIDPSEFDAEFVSTRHTIQTSIEPDASGSGFTIRLPFRETRWAQAGQVILAGSYWLRLLHRATGKELVPRIDGELLEQLPDDRLTNDLRMRIQLRPFPVQTAAFVVGPPLSQAERGARNQRRMRDIANKGQGNGRSVFFRCLYGEAANDTALAVHDELRRRGSDLLLYWSIKDKSVSIPDGGVGLVEGTEAWHRALGDAGYVVLNIHQSSWYVKPAKQVMIQTFHGYPYKGMGQTWWARTELSASRVSSYLDRAGDWDFLVSPSRYATGHLLREFFRPEDAKRVNVIEAGYPRNDVLFSADGEKIRDRTRRALGIQANQIAVLYAPTFRDELSSNGMSASMVDFFDAREAAHKLGPGYVVLMRGHAFNARANESGTVTQDGVIDVTHYPDVAELCLASDAAVLDYSSLRFDYALSRKPMVFMVPDNDRYHAMREALVKYEATAPGLLVTTTDQVVAALRDPGSLGAAYAGQVETFVERFMELEDGHAAERVVDAVFGPSMARVPDAE